MGKKITKSVPYFLLTTVFLLAFVLPILTYAQDSFGTTGSSDSSGTTGQRTCNSTICIENPFKQDSIQGLITTLIKDILMPIGGVVAVLMVMYAGFMYVTAAGDMTKIKKAHNALLWAVIGAAILLGAWVIAEVIEGTIKELKVNG